MSTMTELVAAICNTPQHPERVDYVSSSDPIPNGGLIPNSDGGLFKSIGGLGAVLDAASEAVLKPAALDIIADYNLHKTGIYNGQNFYWYAIDGNRVFHTRTNVIFEVQIFVRPIFAFASQIPLRDHHEKAIVNGAAAYIAQKEGNYSQLARDCKENYAAWIAEIRNFAKFPVAQIDPSET